MRHEQIKRAKRSFSVRGALEWAFGTEHAQLNFDATDAEHRSGLSMEALLMERAILGAQVDTSRGRSFPADDAEIIASFVSALPFHLAICVAEHARAGTTPAVAACRIPKAHPLPVETGGRPGATVESFDFGRLYRTNRIGREVRVEVRYTPIEFRPDVRQIARARRSYLEWWGALLDLGQKMSLPDVLSFEVRNEMPPLRPWEAG